MSNQMSTASGQIGSTTPARAHDAKLLPDSAGDASRCSH
jgi:hypothetical protein